MTFLIYSKTEKDHLNHVQQVFQTLEKNKLYLNLNKCDFLSEELLFLGFVINQEGIKTDPVKVQAIQDWKTPSSITEI